jgi:hypothetical protein
MLASVLSRSKKNIFNSGINAPSRRVSRRHTTKHVTPTLDARDIVSVKSRFAETQLAGKIGMAMLHRQAAERSSARQLVDCHDHNFEDLFEERCI